ncbi:MAG: DUF6371 domain-containing protein [Bacteroidales bacterium]|nr:DUF6371 domain-containing protein [Bacteroidales bacterium]
MRAGHTYALQPYEGPGSRFTCPACRGKRCFTRYVDENGDWLDEAVGRCNHESRCGYHYTPRQFFEDHPSARPDWKENFFRIPQQTIKKTVKKQLWTIGADIVKSTVNPAIESDFTAFLTGLIGRKNTAKIVKEYHIGVTKSKDVIFYQLDTEGRCRTGKIMKYDRQTGHRVKDEKVGGKITWVHAVLRQSADPLLRLPDGWELTQCLFGEHLLRQFPFKPVALVESEKTAVICSAFWPEYIWLATGGKSQLNDRLQVLRGRKVVAFPDVDGYLEWKEKLSRVRGLDIAVSDVLEKEATFEDRANHVDIADLLIRQQRKELVAVEVAGGRGGFEGFGEPGKFGKFGEPGDAMSHPTFLKLKKWLRASNMEEVALLVAGLDLEVVGWWKG